MQFFRRRSSSRTRSTTPNSLPPNNASDATSTTSDSTRGRSPLPPTTQRNTSFSSRSRSRPPPSIPPYIHAALTDPKYLKLVLSTLEDRERQRNHWMTRSPRHSSRSEPSEPQHNTQPPKDALSRYSIRLGMYAQSQGKNRYSGGIVPYDHNIVLPPPSVAKGEYVNASWVREPHGGKWWIAAQAPVPLTTHAFLALCCEPVRPQQSACAEGKGIRARRVEMIVVLTRDIELRVKKADPYIPSTVGSSLTYDPPPDASPEAKPITIKLVRSERLPGQVVRSWLEVNGRGVEHWVFEGWPDHGVPLESQGLLGMVEGVDEVLMGGVGGGAKAPPSSAGGGRDGAGEGQTGGVEKGDGDGDGDDGQGKLAIVHCSAGIGRTGTWIALCSLLRFYGLLRPVRPSPSSGFTSSSAPPLPSTGPSPLNTSNDDNLIPAGPSPLGPFPPIAASPREPPIEDEVAKDVDALREQRTGMLQRDEQVMWVYRVLRECLLRHEKEERERDRSESRGRPRPGETRPPAGGEERGRAAGQGEGDGRKGRSLSRLRERLGAEEREGRGGRSESRDGRRGRGYAGMGGWSEED